MMLSLRLVQPCSHVFSVQETRVLAAKVACPELQLATAVEILPEAPRHRRTHRRTSQNSARITCERRLFSPRYLILRIRPRTVVAISCPALSRVSMWRSVKRQGSHRWPVHDARSVSLHLLILACALVVTALQCCHSVLAQTVCSSCQCRPSEILRPLCSLQSANSADCSYATAGHVALSV